jgi:hypothetical protein
MASPLVIGSFQKLKLYRSGCLGPCETLVQRLYALRMRAVRSTMRYSWLTCRPAKRDTVSNCSPQEEVLAL